MSVVINGSTGKITESEGSLKIGTTVTMTDGATLPATSLSGTVPAGSLSGATLPAGQLTGSVADARLPANIQGFPAPGTSGNTLQSDGTNWTSAAAGGGGGLEFLSTQAGVAGASNMTVTGLDADFDAFVITGSHIIPNADTTANMQWGTSSGFLTTGFVWTHSSLSTANAGFNQFSSSDTDMLMTAQSVNNTSPHGLNFNLTYWKPSTGNSKGFIAGIVQYEIPSGFMTAGWFGGSHQGAGAYDRLRLQFDSSTIKDTVGTITVHGVKQS